MKKFILFLLAMILYCTSMGLAEGVWVEEEWSHVSQKIDCDGLGLVIDARILQIPENTMAQEYHLERLSNDFVISKGQQIDWLQLGCDTSNGSWRKPTDAWPEYDFTTKDVIFPTCSIAVYNLLLVHNLNPEYIYETQADLFLDTVNQIGIEGLTKKQFMAYAEAVASACDYQLGNILRIHRVDQPNMIRESIEAANKKPGSKLDPEKAEEYAFVDAYFPIYFNGLRLYSGDYQGTVDLLEVPNMNLRLAATSGHGIVLINSAILDPAALQAIGDPQLVLTEQEAIQCIADKYSNMIMPGVDQIFVHQMALEYVPITGDVSARKGYTLYPAWVARISFETDTHETITTYEAFHAVTGRPLF